MSACYDIEIMLKIKNEDKVVEILKNKIKEDTESDKVHYTIEKTPNTIEDLMGIFFAKHQDMFNYSKDKNIVRVYSAFNASYGWEVVMIEMFNAISTELENGSKFYLGIENDYDKFIIRNNQVVQTH